MSDESTHDVYAGNAGLNSCRSYAGGIVEADARFLSLCGKRKEGYTYGWAWEAAAVVAAVSHVLC